MPKELAFFLTYDCTAKRSFRYRGHRVIEYFLCVLITLWAVAELDFAVDSLIELQYKFFY
jgi:hypothetical protein